MPANTRELQIRYSYEYCWKRKASLRGIACVTKDNEAETIIKRRKELCWPKEDSYKSSMSFD